MLEKQRSKLLASVPPEKQEKHRRLRQLEKEHAKRKAKFDEARLKATKARNEYLLCMEAANSSIQRYFVEDLSDIIDVRIQIKTRISYWFIENNLNILNKILS